DQPRMGPRGGRRRRGRRERRGRGERACPSRQGLASTVRLGAEIGSPQGILPAPRLFAMAEVQDVSPDYGHLEWETPLYGQAITQFEQALPHAAGGDAVAERLRYPERSLVVSVPVQLDDGTWRVFPGYRVQHSSVLGPTKGGIRYDPEVDLGECAALAMW